MAAQQKTKDLDANTLFENHTIDEVRKVERKIRAEIEWKKEEMRDLVGERYRDLISAADTIREMKECAERVGSTLKDMSTHCQSLKSSHHVKGAMLDSTITKLKPNSKSSLYEVACEIKLLLAVPSRIWRYLDSGDLLSCARLYLLAKHVHGSLQYGIHSGGQISAKFPVIARQWAAISHFREAILKRCKSSLAALDLSDLQVCEALAAIILLEDKTPRQVFQEFLVARMYSGSTHAGGVKNQIGEAVQQLHNTMFQIANIFCAVNITEAESNLLSATIARVLENSVLNDLGAEEISILKPHLPKNIVNFTPSVRVQSSSLTSDYLKSSCDKWISSFMKNVRQSVEDLLGYVTTVKSMAGVREHLWQIITGDERLSYWNEVCLQLLSKPINIWSGELSKLFISRVEIIVQGQFIKLLKDTETQLNVAKGDLDSADQNNVEMNMKAYIWSESLKDIPVNSSWVPSASKTFQDGGLLLMKAHGFTPLVQSLCASLNSQFNELLADWATYRNIHGLSQKLLMLVGDQESGVMNLARYTSDEAYQCVTKLKEHLDTLINDCGNEVAQDSSGKPDSVLKRWLLLLAKFCAAIPKLCPDLEKAVSLSTASQQPAASTALLTSRKSMSRSYSKQVDPLWTECIVMLATSSTAAYQLWSKWLIESLHQEFQSNMKCHKLGENIVNVTRWDDIEIQEDSEDGQTMKSTISVPMQASSCLQRLLNKLCKEVDSIGSYSLNRSVVSELTVSVLECILNVYLAILTEREQKLTQTMALQHLFDVWYVTGLLHWKNTSQCGNLEKLINQVSDGLQSRIDPFDLDVFTPYMQKHANKSRARHMVLFGVIADTEKAGSLSQRHLMSGKQEQHNVLPLFTSTHARFPQLPITSTETFSSTNRISHEQKRPTIPQAASTSNISKVVFAEHTLKTSSSASSFMSWFKS